MTIEEESKYQENEKDDETILDELKNILERTSLRARLRKHGITG